MSVRPGKGKVKCPHGCNLYYPRSAKYCGWCDKPLGKEKKESPSERVAAPRKS